jgi:hypothetical protein
MNKFTRRSLLGLGTGGVAFAAWLAFGPDAAIKGVADWDQLRASIESSSIAATPEGHWSLPKTLIHVAQSIEFSIDGFPEQRSPWFQHTAGATAFALFSRLGRMSHDLTAPIPGASAIAENEPLAAAKLRLEQAIARFESHQGELQAHFAYGKLGRDDYRRAHLMHAANHLSVWSSA